jgi:signal transduction histidine kinase/ligand-binding sensor domain-containing protein/ActR/RegA family two-component response regulator
MLGLVGVAAAERYRFQTFGPEEGLSAAVGRVLQDRTGFLWVSTSDGLFRYDGSRFRRFGVEDGLPSPQILHLAEADDGTLWVLTGRGLARWRSSGFEPVAVPPESDGVEWSAMAVSGHTMYIGTNRGLMMAPLAPNGGKPIFTRVAETPPEPVPGIYASSGEQVWFGCGLQLCLLQNQHLQRFGKDDGLPADRWTAMLIDRHGNLWARGVQNLYVRRYGAPAFEARDQGLPQASNGIMTIIEDREGSVLVSSDLGLARWTGDGWQLIGSAQGLESDAVTSVYQDRQGSVWISVWGVGLSRWAGYGEWTNWTIADGLSNNIIWAIARHPSGALLVGTDRGLVRLQDGSPDKVWMKANGLGGDKIKAVAIGPDGAIWAGSLPGSISRIDPRTGAIHVFGPSEGLSDTRIIALRFDNESRLWVSTGQGLFRSTDAGPHPHFERLKPPGASDGTMYYRFLLDREGRVWVGSTEGLFSWDHGAWTRLTTADGLKSNSVTHVNQTADGAIWVSYREPLGISRLYRTGSQMSVTNVTKTDGLPGDYILFLGMDSRQNLWVGTDTGVAMQSAGAWIVYTHDDGMVWDDCAANGFLAEADGTVWLGTLRGLSRFRPAKNPQLPPPVAAVITSVKFGDRSADPSAPAEVSYRDRDFYVSFASFAFARERSIRFRYRLAGQDERWTETNLRALSYPSLPAGTYRFEVAARADAGPWGPESAVSFRIVPPWWRSWWFETLAACGLLAAIAFVVRSRLRATVRERRRLEDAVRERTEELELQNHVVERQKSEIAELLRQSQEASKLKSEFLANMSHEIRTPMNAVIGMTELALNTALDEEQRDYVTTVRDSAASLLVILNDILDFSKIEAGKLQLSQEPFDVRKSVASAVQLFSWQAKKKGLQLTSQVDAAVPERLSGDADRLRQILVNLLGNAMKFTDSGEVSLTVTPADETESPGSRMRRLRFSVRDTGIGISHDKQAMIFEAFAQADGSTKRRNGGTGLGLAICSGLAHLMNGSIRVESTVGQGSEFSVTLAFEIADRGSILPESAPRTAEPGQAAAPLRILLAEDNRVNQKVAQLTIERMGHSIVVVEDGRQAVDAVRREKFDLVLMDIQMPVMDGSEATALIRELERQDAADGKPAEHIPIVAMTAHAMSGYREECLRAGMDGYITKPIVLGTLKETLERVRSGSAPGELHAPLPG